MEHDTNTQLIIVTWHQVYMPASAGGYVRLKEFLKRIPKGIRVTLLDNKETIYKDVLGKKAIVEYASPYWIEKLQKNFFILWFLLETISSSTILYRLCAEYVKRDNVNVFYFPTAEFSQLYIVSFLLKRKYPHIKVVLDILNYGLLEENYVTYFLKLLKNGSGFIKSSVMTLAILCSTVFMKYTISHADFIVTVSEELVKKIRKDYRKTTVDFTPSGVNIPKRVASTRKKYLGLYIGRITLEKGVFDILSVWEEVVRHTPDAKLALAGFADKTMSAVIHEELRKRNISKQVTFFGAVTEEEKKHLLEESEVFIHLAHQEPLFPVITILEGLSYGLPAIFYDMDVSHEAINKFRLSKKSLFPIKNGDIQLVSQTTTTYKSLLPVEKREISRDAIRNAMKFDWDEISKKEFRILKSFIK